MTSYPHCAVLTHPGHFPAVWRRNCWRFIFLQSILQLKEFLELASASIPLSPTENSRLWRALGIHSAVCLRHPWCGICKGTDRNPWNYFSCLPAGKGAVSRHALSIRALHRISFENRACALQVYSERPRAPGKESCSLPEHPGKETLTAKLTNTPGAGEAA